MQCDADLNDLAVVLSRPCLQLLLVHATGEEGVTFVGVSEDRIASVDELLAQVRVLYELVDGLKRDGLSSAPCSNMLTAW